MIDEVRATGAIFRPWVLANNRPAGGPEHDPLHDWQCRTPAQLFTRLLDRLLAGPARQYAADVISAVDAHPPNRVVLHVRRRRHGGRRSRLHSLRRTDAQHLFIAGAGAAAVRTRRAAASRPAWPDPRPGCHQVRSAPMEQGPRPHQRVPYPAPLEGCYSVLTWLAGLPAVDPARVRARAVGWPLPWPCWPGTAARSRLRCRCWCIRCSTTGQRRGKGSTTRAIGCGTRPATGSAGRHTLAAPILMSQSRPVTRT